MATTTAAATTRRQPCLRLLLALVVALTFIPTWAVAVPVKNPGDPLADFGIKKIEAAIHKATVKTAQLKKSGDKPEDGARTKKLANKKAQTKKALGKSRKALKKAFKKKLVKTDGDGGPKDSKPDVHDDNPDDSGSDVPDGSNSPAGDEQANEGEAGDGQPGIGEGDGGHAPSFDELYTDACAAQACGDTEEILDDIIDDQTEGDPNGLENTLRLPDPGNGDEQLPLNGPAISAVPEPTGLALFVVGLMGWGLLSRRRARLRSLRAETAC